MKRKIRVSFAGSLVGKTIEYQKPGIELVHQVLNEKNSKTSEMTAMP